MSRGRYTIVGKLANGGMAEIFLAKQSGAEGFQKPVVLKRVLSAFSADPQFRNMFIDEAHISMGLSHGNIVQVLDVGLSGERMFLVLELVEGWDLAEVMARAQAVGPAHPWPASLALLVAAQICRALAYAHARRGADGRPLGIIHRDVSPTNILISEQGEVKLTDFGIAKAARKREQTAAGVIKGKISFMSPEQALGHVLDARADLFSLGTVIYLMLTGRKPFEASTDLEALTRAQRADYRRPEELNPYLPRNTIAVLNRAMQREPEARYQTADEMLLDLEKLLRTQYHSAGQSELKRWLAELAVHDGQGPVSRACQAEAELAPPVVPAQPIVIDGPGELSAGSSLELSDMVVRATRTSVEPIVPVAPIVLVEPIVPIVTVEPIVPQAPAAPVEAPAPAVDSALPPRTPSSGVVASRRLRRGGRQALGFVVGPLAVLGAVMAIRWLAQWAGEEAPPAAPPSRTTPTAGLSPVPPGEEAREPSGASAAVKAGGAGAPEAGRPAAPPPEGAALETGEPPRASGGARAESREGVGAAGNGSVVSASGGGGHAPESDDDDEDEAKLLDRAITAPATVIGEDDAELAAAPPEGGEAGAARPPSTRPALEPTTPAPARSHERRAAPRSASGPRGTASPAAPKPVMVRLTSSPLGAVIRTRHRVLGRTPLAIRFAPGNTYALTFVKSGYATTTRPVVVHAGKPASVSVAMKRKATAPSPPLLHGLFRGR